MGLKSYRLKLKKKKSKKGEGIISQGASALIGIALLSETARAVSRL